MELLGYEVDSWVIASILGGLMVSAWAFGWYRGVHKTMTGKLKSINVNEAILGLFGLLLGFTFSMSLGKHDQRRMMLINDSNCISDFATCASMVKEPVRGKLLVDVRKYLTILLTPFPKPTNIAAFNQKLDEIEALQADMQSLVTVSVNEGTPVAVPLVNTLIGMSSSYAARLASLRDRLPLEIVLLLCFAGIVTMMLQGQRQGEAGNALFTPSLGFILLACMVIWVTLDLNQPNRGFIHLNKEPLERVLASLNR